MALRCRAHKTGHYRWLLSARTGKSENVERWPFSPVLDGVAQDTHPLDLHFEDIARLHEDRWLARRPNATGCSGDDHITRLQTHRDADHFDQRGDAEDELVGTRILHHSAV